MKAKISFCVGAWLGLLPFSPFATASISQPFFAEYDIFVPEHGDFYRVPTLITSDKGTILLFAEKKIGHRRDAGGKGYSVLRRSTDNGQTWLPEQIVHGKSPVVDYRKKRILTVNWSFPLRDSRGQPMTEEWLIGHPGEIKKLGAMVVLSYSDDDGETWSSPRDISEQVLYHPSGSVAWSIGHGIQLKCGAKKGRLIIPARYFPGNKMDQTMQNTLIYSDDHGQTWKFGGSAQPGTGECCIVELAKGALYLNSRNHGDNDGYRAWCISYDGGESFTKFGYDSTLIESRCHAGISRFPPANCTSGGPILFSNPAAQIGRYNLTVRISNDEAVTWTAARVICSKPSAYSDLTVTKDGFIICAYETGLQNPYEKIVVARFNLEWLIYGHAGINKNRPDLSYE